MRYVPDSADMTDRPLVSPAAPPYLECIQWVPRRFSGGGSPSVIVDLVFTQSALEAVHAQITAANGSPVFGAMIGAAYKDPSCSLRWARIDGIVPSPAPVPEAAAVDDLAAAMGAIDRSTTGHAILGWYRTHHEAGLYLSPEEAEFHERRFDDPTGFALIVAGTNDRLAGGIFQRTDPEGLSRSVYTPFYELTDESARVSSTIRRTVLSWTNYQTEARVLRPGEPVSPTVMTVAGLRAASSPPAEPSNSAPDVGAGTGLPTDETPSQSRPAAALSGPRLVEEIAAVVSEAEANTTAGAPGRPGHTAAGPAQPAEPTEEELAEAESQREAEAEWEKIQIQRSLMAVGRSLGPSTISELGAPAPESPPTEQGEQPAEAPEDTGPEPAQGPPRPVQRPPQPPARPELTVIEGRGRPESVQAPGRGADVIPITGGPPVDERPGLVGRARRRRPIPVAKIALAAAGVTIMLGAGWMGTRALGGGVADGGGGVADGGDGPGESAVAGMSLAPGDMFANEGADSSRLAGVDDAESGPGLDSDEAGGADGAATAASLADPTGESGQTDDPGAPPTPSPQPPQVVDAPVLDSLDIVDPAISAFETALSIFRTEVDRYEEVRREFDDGLSTCNPLNLAFRGAIEAHDRLERRHADVAGRLSAEGARAFNAANRQYTVTRTHYELTDCPMPVGG